MHSPGDSELCWKETERMACGVEHHPDLFLWLMVDESGAGIIGLLDCGVEILDRDVEMHHHLLLTGHRGPGWSLVVRVILE